MNPKTALLCYLMCGVSFNFVYKLNGTLQFFFSAFFVSKYSRSRISSTTKIGFRRGFIWHF